ncbi:MarR family transcriptional regulator [Bacillus infantis]|uniref:MarR family winged helix-turn-helix transcriptional regulator n=1 Tax=Bacillus infantis TaxID=324767 RepID=UPI001CD70D3D|nr:MarR family transcriptional regulator [Bacillus infantis]MCA1037952.1 MarR family transcriptional regulator [Bacillus infantis]
MIYDLIAAMRGTVKRSKADFHGLFDGYIPFNEFLVLRRLTKGESKVSQLAGALGVSSSHITAVSEKLLAKGLIVRAGSEQDRRIVYLSLTDEGRKMAAELERVFEDYFEEKLRDLSDEELALTSSLLGRIH